jgi:hypothetical protein
VRASISDLVASALGSPPSAAAQGGTFDLAVTTANVGTGATEAGSVTRFFLFADTTLVRLVGAQELGLLAAAASAPTTVPVSMPARMPVGTYRLFAYADDSEQASEFDEANNHRVASTQVTIIQG